MSADRSIGRRLLIWLVIMVLLAGLAYAWIPLIAGYVLASSLADLGNGQREPQTAVTWGRAVAGPVTIGEGDSAIHIERMTIDYTLGGLINRQIRELNLYLPTTAISYQDGTWELPGLGGDSGRDTHWQIQTIRVHQAHLRLAWQDLTGNLTGIDAEISLNGDQASINAEAPGLFWEYGDLSLLSGPLVAELQLTTGTPTGQGNLQLPMLQLSRLGTSLTLRDLDITSEWRDGAPPDTVRIRAGQVAYGGWASSDPISATVQLRPLQLDIDGRFHPAQASSGRLLKTEPVEGRLTAKVENQTLRGTLHAQSGWLAVGDSLAYESLQAELPIAWSVDQGLLPTTGNLRLGALRVLGVSTPSLPASLELSADGLRAVAHQDIEQLHLPAQLAGTGSLELILHLPLAGWSEAPDLRLRLRDVDVQDPRRDIQAEGLSGEVVFTSLVPLQSAHHQALRSERLRLGKVTLSQVDLAWHLHDTQTLFLEQARFRMFGGTAAMQVLRWNLADPDLAIDLYAEDLELDQLLDLQTMAEASAEGSLHGRLSLHYTNQNLRLHSLYLYSLPGRSGILKVHNPEELVKRLPQQKRMEMVRDALKHLRYDYIRIRGDSPPDQETKVQLSLRGHAVNRPDLAPIDLNLNLSLPLDRLFDIYRNLQDADISLE